VNEISDNHANADSIDIERTLMREVSWWTPSMPFCWSGHWPACSKGINASVMKLATMAEQKGIPEA
jgi:hypothetical protein